VPISEFKNGVVLKGRRKVGAEGGLDLGLLPRCVIGEKRNIRD